MTSAVAVDPDVLVKVTGDIGYEGEVGRASADLPPGEYDAVTVFEERPVRLVVGAFDSHGLYRDVVAVTVLVPLGPQRLADKCDVATVAGEVAEALADGWTRFGATHAADPVRLTAQSFDPEDTSRLTFLPSTDLPWTIG